MPPATRYSAGWPANHLKTTYSYDAQGRLDSTTLPDGRVTKNFYTRLADQRLVTISVPRVVSGTFSGIYDPADAAGTYSNIDRFGRVTASKWTKDLTTDRTFYHVTNTYDRNSNITLHDDQIYPTWDSAYTVDGLNRLTSAGTGTWNGTAITSGTRNELWNSGGLDQLGNWKRYKLDLNNDGDWADANEMDDSRTFNVANELTARDTDTNGTANHSPTYDAVGNMTDDGKAYKLEYDAFGRMRFIKDRGTNAVIEEFRYSGLNHRIGWHYDSDGDSDVDANDTWYYFVYDRQWRMVATVRNGDTEAKEIFVNHQAGANGMQTALPLDAVVLRDRHTSTWSADASGSSYGRAYYCQNFIGGRGDVVAVLASDGKLSQQVRYSAYGVPTGIPAGDTNADGSIVGTPDITMMNSWIGTAEVRGDLDLDGDCDADDMSILTSNFALGLGWNKLSVHPDSSLSGVRGGHRKGYCGYEHSLLNHSVMHVRNRVYFAELGRRALGAREAVGDRGCRRQAAPSAPTINTAGATVAGRCRRAVAVAVAVAAAAAAAAQYQVQAGRALPWLCVRASRRHSRVANEARPYWSHWRKGKISLGSGSHPAVRWRQ